MRPHPIVKAFVDCCFEWSVAGSVERLKFMARVRRYGEESDAVFFGFVNGFQRYVRFMVVQYKKDFVMYQGYNEFGR